MIYLNVLCFGTEMVEGCVGSRLIVRCDERKVIKITAVVLGDSYGIGAVCYIRNNDCTHSANENHTMDVQRRCDNKESCIVDVFKEIIPCGFLGSSTENDFERITYICLDDRRSKLAI